MSRRSAAEQRWRDDAIRRGVSGEQQYSKAYATVGRCWEGCKRVSPARLPDAYATCNGLDLKVKFLSKAATMAGIDNAIGLPNLQNPAPGQKSSDTVYDNAFWNFFNKDPGDVQTAMDALIADIDKNGLTPAKRALLHAYGDIIRGDPYLPPAYDLTVFTQGHGGSDEEN